MESDALQIDYGQVVHVKPSSAGGPVMVVCEHASNRIPKALNDLGLSSEGLRSHVAWDPGALAVAQGVAAELGAGLVWGGVSRLVYDCNRPPDAESAMPARSEAFTIPGNQALSAATRADRIASVYDPFRTRLAAEIMAARETLRVLMTVHSFSPVYHGAVRAVEIGILHGRDDRLAKAMIDTRPQSPFDVRLNEPYSAADGVAHTIDLHGEGLLSVMIEIRNDLIATPDQQAAMAARLSPWIAAAIEAAV